MTPPTPPSRVSLARPGATAPWQVITLDGATPEDAARWQAAVPVPAQAAAPTHAVVRAPAPDDGVVLAQLDMTRLVLLHLPHTQAIDLRECVALWAGALPLSGDAQGPLVPPAPWADATRQAHIAQLHALAGGAGGALALLAALLSDGGVQVVGAPTDQVARTALVHGVLALLPGPLRGLVTFACHDVPVSVAVALDFAEGAPGARTAWHWGAVSPLPGAFDGVPYVRALAEAGSAPDVLAATADALAPLLGQVAAGATLGGALGSAQARLATYQQRDASLSALVDALSDAATLPPGWAQAYAGRLLPQALAGRDAEAARAVARVMDSDPQADVLLGQALDEALGESADDVYALARARLAADGPDARWLARLQAAAARALDVALAEGDAETLLSWLRLLAREPDDYNLDALLADGLRRAAPRASGQPDFAQRLLALAARHATANAQALLDHDPAFVAALPPATTAALVQHDGEALAALPRQSPGLLLLGVRRALDARAAGAFSAPLLERVWALAAEPDVPHLPAPYSIEAVRDDLLRADWLPSSTYETLLALVLAEDHPAPPHLLALAAHLAARDALAGRLAGALEASGRDGHSALDVLAMLAANSHLSAQQTFGVLADLLNRRGMGDASRPLLEQVGRHLAQHPDVAAPPSLLAALLDAASALRDEPLARVVAKRLLAATDPLDDEALLQMLERVSGRVAWSAGARATVLAWWRGFLRGQPTVRLGRIERAMEGMRQLDEAVRAVHSTTAVRRLVGKRTPEEFVRDVSAAYVLLEALADAFDPPGDRQPTDFDAEAARAELDAFSRGLPQHERQILANAMKQLARLVAQMGDNRSKPGRLTRREDAVDRSLITGEQPPSSAVDALKWLAGYYGGAQQPDDKM